MTVRYPSRIAYAAEAGSHALIRQRIVAFVASAVSTTRRAIAEGLHLETSCVAGRVNELVRTGALVEFGLDPCPITGRRVHWLRLPSMEEAA